MAKKRFSRSKPLNKKHVEQIPDDLPANYKITSQAGKLIYTGIAKRGRVQDRLLEHLPDAPDAIPGGSKFSVKQAQSVDLARQEEKRIIQQEHPTQNKKKP